MEKPSLAKWKSSWPSRGTLGAYPRSEEAEMKELKELLDIPRRTVEAYPRSEEVCRIANVWTRKKLIPWFERAEVSWGLVVANGHMPKLCTLELTTEGPSARLVRVEAASPKLPENTRPPLTAHKAPPVKEAASDVPPRPLAPPPLKGDAARLYEIFKKTPVQLARSTAMGILEVKPKGKELGNVNQGPSATDAYENKPLSSEAEVPTLNCGFDPNAGMNPLHDAATTTSSHDSSGQHSTDSHKKRQKLRKSEVVDPEVLLRNPVRQQPSVAAEGSALSVGDPDPDTNTSLEDTAIPYGNVETSKEPTLSSVPVTDTGTPPEDTATPNDRVKARKEHTASGVGDRIPDSATHNSPEDTATPNNKAETPNEATAPDTSNPVADTPPEDPESVADRLILAAAAVLEQNEVSEDRIARTVNSATRTRFRILQLMLNVKDAEVKEELKTIYEEMLLRSRDSR
ncbi:MAG: hypothetical protein Q9226_002973 [Calogaya cf. arnoldii]